MACRTAYTWLTWPPPLTRTLISSMLSLSFPSTSTGSCTFSLRISGVTSAIGDPLSLRSPVPRLAWATAVAVFLRPYVCTCWACIYGKDSGGFRVEFTLRVRFSKSCYFNKVCSYFSYSEITAGLWFWSYHYLKLTNSLKTLIQCLTASLKLTYLGYYGNTAGLWFWSY